MPVSYKFINRKTEKATPIAQIDHEICQYFNIEEDPKECSLQYETIVMVGVGACWNTGVCTRENVEAHIKKIYEGKLPRKQLLDAYRKFLYKDYRFESWSGGF